MDRSLLRSRLAWFLCIANTLAIAAVAWISLSKPPSETSRFRIAPVSYSDLPGWTGADPRAALSAFRRSCVTLEGLPPDRPMGLDGYAGTVADWLPICRALPDTDSIPALRAWFEHWFIPVEIGPTGHFTGYYEPLLAGSLRKHGRYRVPVYGRPTDLVTADLEQFRPSFAGEHITGRLDGTRLVPYETRAEIDARGLPNAPILLYTDDPVSLFFLQIQGSGRIKLDDGQVLRLVFADKNGRPYTPIGRVLIAQGALDRKTVSLQSIRSWLTVHPVEAQSVMEADQSYVFFSLALLGDPSLGSPGTQGVALTPRGSAAVDPRIHPMGAPVYVAASIPDSAPGKPDQRFAALLIAQDTGGAIRGPARTDVFFGSGSEAEEMAGRMNAHGKFFVLVPKVVAAALSPFKEFAGAPP